MHQILSLLFDLWSVTRELAPWLLLGAALSGAVAYRVPEHFVRRYLAGRAGVIRAVIVGIPLPLCSCGVVPAGIGLRKNGASNGAAIGFLIATPQTGVDSIVASGGMLGWPFAFFKVIAALVTGVVGGYFADLVAGAELETPQHAEAARRRITLAQAAHHSIEIIRSIWKWLAVGILVSVLIERVMTGFIVDVADVGIVASTGLALVISLPLYVCATASVPIAAQLIASGMPAGAALVFLMAGPATNAATIGAIRSQFGWKLVGVYLATIILGSIAFAVLFDTFFTSTFQRVAHDHGHSLWWNYVAKFCGFVLLSMIAYFAWGDVRRMVRGQQVNFDSGFRIHVDGMTCQGCAATLTQKLEAVPGVTAAHVTLSPDQATVNGTASEQSLRGAIESAGFSVREVATLSAEHEA
ncbi:MAG: permease [Planctomycetales bacterium]|nr:permease [Planctomycetales bacterium]